MVGGSAGRNDLAVLRGVPERIADQYAGLQASDMLIHFMETNQGRWPNSCLRLQSGEEAVWFGVDLSAKVVTYIRTLKTFSDGFQNDAIPKSKH